MNLRPVFLGLALTAAVLTAGCCHTRCRTAARPVVPVAPAPCCPTPGGVPVAPVPAVPAPGVPGY
jgi:hypothetical protein